MKKDIQKIETRIYGETRCSQCNKILLWEHTFPQNVINIKFANVYIRNSMIHYAKIKKVLNEKELLLEITCKYCNKIHEFIYKYD